MKPSPIRMKNEVLALDVVMDDINFVPQTEWGLATSTSVARINERVQRLVATQVMVKVPVFRTFGARLSN